MTLSLTRAAATIALLCSSVAGLQWQGLPPAPRYLATIVIDQLNRRAVMFGGGSGTTGTSDVWTLDLDSKGGYTWESLPTSGPTPGGRVGHTAIYDPIHHWMVVFGGRTFSGFTNEWPYIFVGEAPDRQGTGPDQSSLRQVSSFSPGPVKVRFLVSGMGHVNVRVFDQSGRVVRSLVSGTFSPGSHEVTWDGRNARGRAIPSGAYFFRLETGDMQVSMKFVLLQ